MVLLLVGNRTRSVWVRTAGIGLTSRQVGTPSHTQSTAHGERGLITVGGCCKTIRITTGRCAGNRESRKGWAAYKGGGDVIADHPPLGGIGEPGECHRASYLRIGGPLSSAIR